jgi:F-type H+-transporting ATPase subunit gamma
MPSSLEIEERIRTFHDIADIVNAMKAYAGLTVRRTEEIVPEIRMYEENMLNAMSDILSYFPDMPLLRDNGGRRILVAFGSSQGLCGPYNDRVAETVAETILGTDVLFIIGKKLASSLELRHTVFAEYAESVLSINGIQPALQAITTKIIQIYKKEEFLNLTLLFTYVSEGKALVSVEQVLPPDISSVRQQETNNRQKPFTYLDPEIIFAAALEEFLYISLYRAYAESLRSENWYRLRSMEGASESLKRRIGDLGSLQKYVRQEEVTEEMLEILGSGMFYKSR